MKKIISTLSALTIICNVIMTNTISVNAMEAATYIEQVQQAKEREIFPDPDASYYTFTEDNLEYHIYDNYAVLYECNDREITEIEIPEKIKDLPVVGSVDSPFGFCRNLKKITLPDTFEHFNWCNLVSTTTRRIIYGSCGANTGVFKNLPNSSLKTNSNNNDTIDDNNDNKLVPSVSEVIISETNPYYTSVDGIIYTKDMKTLIGCPPAKDIKELKISEQAERINDYAFSLCYNLEKAVIPVNIEHINNSAFLGCINLKYIEFPENITSISGEMCYDCESLSEVVFNGDIEKIGYSAFRQCYALESFDIPETVSYIGSYAFEQSGCIEDINGIYYIDNWVVDSSQEVKNVNIAEGTIGIAEGAFFIRNNIRYINVPSSIKYLGLFTFAQLKESTNSTMDYRCSFIGERTMAPAKSNTDFYIYDPECDIFDSEKTIPAKYRYKKYVETNKEDSISWTEIDNKYYEEVIEEIDTVIHGYAGSTAQAYAEKYNRKFELIEDNNVTGDANGDGTFNVADIVIFQKWLLGSSDFKFYDWKVMDLCKDGELNVFDLCMMKYELINN